MGIIGAIIEDEIWVGTPPNHITQVDFAIMKHNFSKKLVLYARGILAFWLVTGFELANKKNQLLC